MKPRNLYIQTMHYKKPESAHSNDYPHHLSFLKPTISFHKPVTIITGENGTGKSTLIETLAALVGLNMEGGSKNHRFMTKESHSSLYNYCSLTRGPYRPKDAYFYRAESFYNLVSDMDQQDEYSPALSNQLFGKELHSFSRGEALKELVKNRFFGSGFYLMDEPETGLSATSQFELLVAMKTLVEKQSQLILATHSPILLMYPGAQIIEISKAGLKESEREETKLYQDWKMFFDRGSHFIDQLFL